MRPSAKASLPEVTSGTALSAVEYSKCPVFSTLTWNLPIKNKKSKLKITVILPPSDKHLCEACSFKQEMKLETFILQQYA